MPSLSRSLLDALSLCLKASAKRASRWTEGAELYSWRTRSECHEVRGGNE